MISIYDFKEKIDYILDSTEPEREYLIDDINCFYETLKKNKSSAQVIEYDFKKKKVIAFFEYLTDQDLGKNF